MKSYGVILLIILFGTHAYAQKNVSGHVRDEKGSGLSGVTVSVPETAVSTATDTQGRFSLAIPDGYQVLRFTMMGFLSQDVTVQDQQTIDVQLVEEGFGLDEVVVVGYGAVRKRDLTGAVGSIKAEELENRVLHSLDDALSGGVAGLMVQSSGGQPGAASNILIRGANSLSGSTQPLIVVDGFPLFEVATGAGGGMSDRSGDLSAFSMINPDDIASIEVLKDASATAIYGNRGANGVILITTKRGSGTGSRIQYSNYFSAQQLPRQYDVLDFHQYAEYQVANNPTRNLFINQGTGQLYDFDPNIRSINWQDEIYRTGFLQNHSLSLQNATEKTNFMVSSSYMQNQSIIKNTNWDKLTGKVTIDHQFSSKLKIGGDVNYSQVKDDGVPTGGGDGTALGVVIGAILARPFELDETTQAYFRRAGVDQSIIDSDLANYREDPLNLVNAVDMSKTIDRTILNAYLEYNILDNLLLRVTGGYDIYGLKDQQFYPRSTPTGNFYNGLGILANINSRSWINENTLTWTPYIADKHRLTILGGVTEQGWSSDYLRTEFSSFENESLGYNNAQMAVNFNTYSSPSATRYMSFIGRTNYAYDDKYLLTFTVRHDGASVFRNNKWSTFYSGAFAYNMMEEDFIRNIDAISNLRLRLSLGEVGNSNVPTTGAYAQLYNTNYNFGNSIAVGQSAASLANENLRWERTREWNAGFEVGFLQDRFSLTADYYIKDTRDLLLEAPVLNISGYDRAWQNIGRLQNRGIELTLGAEIIQKENFRWAINTNFAYNKSEVKELGQNGAPIYLSANFISGSGGQQAIILEEGGRIGTVYGYVATGVYGANDFYNDGTARPGTVVEGVGEAPGWIKYADINGDGRISAEDRQVIANTLPDFFGALMSDFTWKNLDLHLAFQYSQGNQLFNANYIQAARFGTTMYNQMAFYQDRWTYENPESTQYAQMSVGTISSAFVEDASFLRFRTARLTYTVPPAWLARSRALKGLRVYIAADNLYTFTRYSGYDPEVNQPQGDGSMTNVLTSGFDYGVFPRARTFTGGLNFTF